MRTFDEILRDKSLTPDGFTCEAQDLYKEAALKYANERLDEVTTSLSELIRTLQRINNTKGRTLSDEDWRRLKSAQEVLSRNADYSQPRIVKS